MTAAIKGQKEHSIQTMCLIILTTIGIAASLYWLRPVMIPFVLALFFTFIFNPLIDLQTKYGKIPKGIALINTLLLVIVLLVGFSLILSSSINQMTANADSYYDKIQTLTESTLEKLPLEKLGVDRANIKSSILQSVRKNIGNVAFGSFNKAVGLFSKGVLVLIFVIFLMLGKAKQTKPLTGVWFEGEKRVKSYIIAKVVISGITGFLVWITLMILGIDLALVFGMLAFLLNFIPSIGSIIATLLPLPIVLASEGISPLIATMAIAIPGAIQVTIGNVIEPKIMGESLDLHPVVILMALIFWGMVWGIVGMLLAAPLTAIMKIIFENIELTRPMAQLLAGRIDSDSPSGSKA